MKFFLFLSLENVFAEQTCQPNASYRDCGTACPRICKQENVDLCAAVCVSGCFCDDGYILNTRDGFCIPESICLDSCPPGQVLQQNCCTTPEICVCEEDKLWNNATQTCVSSDECTDPPRSANTPTVETTTERNKSFDTELSLLPLLIMFFFVR
ncbi:Oidioi.mRNA.OKI2018_I69.PAR.g8550.t1.cds [Oikopleura dioica]|uniref:Oidioi.mRNA.OKI2018_I69.PAR.g8550.t1.cds n=1 Tax=Oikopleura dioica TaxID=34765 RepID=A0ABN7RJ17_OIKDI|nr:Oidioi.mRNA.OKI2018_I69.PAR.g8550.t1.cds [Oikopleura dioica]